MNLFDRTNLAILKIMVGSGAMLLLPGPANAQTAGLGGASGPVDGMVNAVCSLIQPMVGKSKVVSLVFLIALGVMVFMWWMSENKEGVITWVLRTGLAIGVLINLFTLPTLLGLPPVCSGGMF